MSRSSGSGSTTPRSRADLHADLFQLHAALPLWRRELPSEADFLAQYQTLSERILAAAGHDDREWVEWQLRDLLPSRYLQPAGRDLSA